jgi:hypothetical protein
VSLPLPAAPVGAIDVFKDFPLQKLRDALSDWAQQLGSIADNEINKKLACKRKDMPDLRAWTPD